MPHRTAPKPTDAASFIGDYLLYLLARASYDLSAEFHARLRRMGFSIREWRVLATLSGPTPVTVGTLAEACLTQQPTMTKLLDRMERAGLVARLADPRDRRRTTVTITESGRTRVARMLEAARAHESEILTRLGPVGEDLKHALRRILAQQN